MDEELKTLASPLGPQREQAAPSFGHCLGNDDILAFVQGQFEGDNLERVHVHVDACDICQRLVAEAAQALDAEPISETARPSWNTVFQSNAMIGKRYRVLRLVARGGMGEVYEAYDTALHERIALKTVTSTDCDSVKAVRSLKAEVQLARRISHPNVCRIYDLGTHVTERSGAEICFLVMEFVEGECLGKRLRQRGALPFELAQSIAHQLLLGLRAAHQAGILHRDFKSDNVMLRHEGNGRVTPVILDFGLARALNESGNMATTQNQGQGMVGTIGYMAPEQIEGEPLSTASDLYAFGIVWFEMLTGRLPFEGDTPVASAMARLHRPPAVPSSLNPQVPGWLDDIVLCCLSRHRSNRFTSAEQVLDAIASAQAATPSELPVSSRIGRRWRAATLVVVVTMAGAGSLILRPQPRLRMETWAVKPMPLPLPGVRILPQAPDPIAIAQQTVVGDKPRPSATRTRRIADRPGRSEPLPRGPGSSEELPAVAPANPTNTSSYHTIANPKADPFPARTPPNWLPIWSRKVGSKPQAVVD